MGKSVKLAESLRDNLGTALAHEGAETRRMAAIRNVQARLQAVVDHPNGGQRLFVDHASKQAPHGPTQSTISAGLRASPSQAQVCLATTTLLSLTDDVKAMQIATCALISIGELDRAIETANSGLMRLGDTEPLAAALHESAGFANKLSGRYGTAIGHFMRGATSQIHEVAAACAASGFLLTASLGRPRATAWFVSRSRDLGPDVIAPLVLKKAHLQGLRRPPDLDTRGAVRLVEFHNA